MDKLEKYILEHRNELDLYAPDEKIWENIQGKSRVRYLSRRRVISVAATIAVLLGTTMGIMWFGKTGITQNNPPALLESEIYYSRQLESLINEAQPYFTSNPSVGTDLMNEISSLDSIYLEIKKDLKDNISNEEVIEALINNYRVRILILEEMLLILKEENNNEKISGHEI